MSKDRTRIPDSNPETGPFWKAAAEGRLLVKRCRACGKAHFYPRDFCPHCLHDETDWVQSSGKGVIYSVTVMRRADPAYAVAYVTLEEGVSLLTNIVDCDLDGLQIGDAVELRFRALDDRNLPVFTPVQKDSRDDNTL